MQYILSAISTNRTPEITRAFFIRFVVLETRQGKSQNASNFEIDSIGVLLNGQSHLNATSQIYRSGATVVLEFNKSVPFNGWYFKTSNSSIESDPIKFFVESFSNGVVEKSGEAMSAQRALAPSSMVLNKIGASSVFITDYGERRLREWMTHATTVERGARETFDLHVPWQITLQHQVKTVLASASCLWLSSCYFTKHYHSARWVLAASSLFSCLAMALCAASLRGAPHVTALLAARAASAAAVGAMAGLWEHRNPVTVLLLDAALQAAATAAQSLFLDWDPAALRRAAAVILPHATAVCVGAWWALERRRVGRAAAALVRADEAEYGRLYAALAAASPDALARLRTALAHHALRRGLPAPPRCGPEADVEAPPPAGWPAAQRCRQLAEGGGPVASLSRLYAAAEGTDPLLRAKVLAWGAAAGALFPVRDAGPGRPAYARLGAAGGGVGPEGIQWAPLKGASAPPGWAAHRTGSLPRAPRVL
jgi:hypothetical protein